MDKYLDESHRSIKLLLHNLLKILMNKNTIKNINNNFNKLFRKSVRISNLIKFNK